MTVASSAADESVREATIDDVVELAGLERDARQSLEDQRGGPQLLAESPMVGDWAAIIAGEDRFVAVGTVDGVVLGYLEMVVDGPAAVVRQVYVEPEARELGLGDGMLGLAMERARAVGCVVIEGTALPGDRETKNLYERAHVTARKITVSRRL